MKIESPANVKDKLSQNILVTSLSKMSLSDGKSDVGIGMLADLVKQFSIRDEKEHHSEETPAEADDVRGKKESLQEHYKQASKGDEEASSDEGEKEDEEEHDKGYSSGDGAVASDSREDSISAKYEIVQDVAADKSKTDVQKEDETDNEDESEEETDSEDESGINLEEKEKTENESGSDSASAEEEDSNDGEAEESSDDDKGCKATSGVKEGKKKKKIMTRGDDGPYTQHTSLCSEPKLDILAYSYLPQMSSQQQNIFNGLPPNIPAISSPSDIMYTQMSSPQHAMSPGFSPNIPPRASPTDNMYTPMSSPQHAMSPGFSPNIPPGGSATDNMHTPISSPQHAMSPGFSPNMPMSGSPESIYTTIMNHTGMFSPGYSQGELTGYSAQNVPDAYTDYRLASENNIVNSSGPKTQTYDNLAYDNLGENGCFQPQFQESLESIVYGLSSVQNEKPLNGENGYCKQWGQNDQEFNRYVPSPTQDSNSYDKQSMSYEHVGIVEKVLMEVAARPVPENISPNNETVRMIRRYLENMSPNPHPDLEKVLIVGDSHQSNESTLPEVCFQRQSQGPLTEQEPRISYLPSAEEDLRSTLDLKQLQKYRRLIAPLRNEEITHKDPEGDFAGLVVASKKPPVPSYCEQLVAMQERQKDINVCCETLVDSTRDPVCLVCKEKDSSKFYSPLSMRNNQGFTILTAAMSNAQSPKVINYICGCLLNRMIDFERVFVYAPEDDLHIFYNNQQVYPVLTEMLQKRNQHQTTFATCIG